MEDPRVTWVEALGCHVMTYVAYGPLGPRSAIATSTDLRTWTRHGPVSFVYEDALNCDLNLFHNKDTVFFPEPVEAPDGTPSLAVLHRPMWVLDEVQLGEGRRPPAGAPDERDCIWISFVPLAAAQAQHRHPDPLGASTASWPVRRARLGGPQGRRRSGPGAHQRRLALDPPRGVGRTDARLRAPAATGALRRRRDAARSHSARGRWGRPSSSQPLLEPEDDDERSGIVPNVVFPTAIEVIDDVHYVFYGMADSKIGVARLDSPRNPDPDPAGRTPVVSYNAPLLPTRTTRPPQGRFDDDTPPRSACSPSCSPALALMGGLLTGTGRPRPAPRR